MTRPKKPNSGFTEPQSAKAEHDISPDTDRDMPRIAPIAGAAVNIAIAEIVLRTIADRMRFKVEEDIFRNDLEKRKAGQRDAVDGRSLLTSVGLYGAARLAKRSPAGLGVVAGGLLAKSLYDRGKAVRKRRLGRKDKSR